MFEELDCSSKGILRAANLAAYQVHLKAFKDKTPYPVWRNGQVEYELPKVMPRLENY